MSQRGTQAQIISDNAKQFKLTKSAIDRLWEKATSDEDVLSYVSQNGIKWSFIPEKAPWMGGFYERLVQSVKRALKKSIHNGQLTYIQLETLMIEIESMLNSRPLVHVGSDFKDGRSLTPSHFLSINPKSGMPSMVVEDKMDPDYAERIASKEALLPTWHKGE